MPYITELNLLTSDEKNMLASGLYLAATELTTEAKSRKWAGEKWATTRRLFREEAAGLRSLAARIDAHQVALIEDKEGQS